MSDRVDEPKKSATLSPWPAPHNAPQRALPLWLKSAYSTLVAVVVPVYLRHYGWRNFLWLSDIALLSLTAALWLEHRLTISIMAVATLVYESAWLADFIALLHRGRSVLGITDYMANPDKPRYLRALSLFHLALPPTMLFALHRLGYDRRAWVGATLLSCALFPLSRRVSPPRKNINWAYGPGKNRRPAPALIYIPLLLAVTPVAVYGPTHLLLRRLFGQPRR